MNEWTVMSIEEMVRDYEFNEEKPCAIRSKETLGLCYVLKGLEQMSQADMETVCRKSLWSWTGCFATVKALKSSE